MDTGTAAANKYIGDAGTVQKDIYGNEQAGIKPYQDAGTYGLNKMQSQGDFSFNPSDLQNEPGYQFQLQQGQKALQASAAGRGMLQSGSLLKSMDNYSQGLAGTSYQNAYNRALSTFDTNRSGYQTLAGMGQTANSQNLSAGATYGGQTTSLANLGANVATTGEGIKSNVAQQGNQWVGNTGLQGAEASGNARMGAANATAAGIGKAANAWSGAIGGVGGAAMYGLNQMSSTPNGSEPAGSPAGVPGGIPISPWNGMGGTPYAAPNVPAYPSGQVTPWQQQGG